MIIKKSFRILTHLLSRGYKLKGKNKFVYKEVLIEIFTLTHSTPDDIDVWKKRVNKKITI